MAAGATSLPNDPTPRVVDESDFLYWRDHFGETLGSGSGGGSAAAPEPCAASLLCIGALGVVASKFHRPMRFGGSCFAGSARASNTYRDRLLEGSTDVKRAHRDWGDYPRQPSEQAVKWRLMWHISRCAPWQSPEFYPSCSTRSPNVNAANTSTTVDISTRTCCLWRDLNNCQRTSVNFAIPAIELLRANNYRG